MLLLGGPSTSFQAPLLSGLLGPVSFSESGPMLLSQLPNCLDLDFLKASPLFTSLLLIH